MITSGSAVSCTTTFRATRLSPTPTTPTKCARIVSRPSIRPGAVETKGWSTTASSAYRSARSCLRPAEMPRLRRSNTARGLVGSAMGDSLAPFWRIESEWPLRFLQRYGVVTPFVNERVAVTPPRDGRPLRADALRNRGKVLQAAEAVFDAWGTTASTEEVARAAGVGIGTVFRHFPPKETLLEAVYVARMVVHAATKNAFSAALMLAGVDVRETTAETGRELKRALAALLGRAQEAGAVRRDVGVAEVMTLLVGAARAAEHGTDPRVHERALAVVFDGLRVSFCFAVGAGRRRIRPVTSGPPGTSPWRTTRPGRSPAPSTRRYGGRSAAPARVRQAPARRSGHSDARIVSTKSVRSNPGTQWLRTSAFTVPNVLSGRWAIPPAKARTISRMKSGRGCAAVTSARCSAGISSKPKPST